MGGASGGSQSQQSKTQSSNFADMFNLQEAFNQAKSYVDPVQQGFTQNLWQQGAGMTNPAQAQAASQGMVGQAMPGMQAAMKSATALSDPKSQIAAQAASLQSGLGQMFRQEMMPALKSNAIASGGFGGGRQGIAEARGAGQLADAYTKGYGDIVAGANATALGAGELAGSLGGQIYNLGMMPSMAGFAPLQAMAGLLGSPTVLQSSMGRSSGKGGSHSEGKMKSKSGGSGWNTGFNIL
jgi:hypothetical protein